MPRPPLRVSLSVPVRFLITVMAGALLAGSVTAGAATRELTDFSRLVEKHGPTVVNISTSLRLAPARRRAVPETPPARPDEGGPANPEGASLGSGLIISPDGYILTCAHVVEDAREILVRLTDRREFSARLIGADRRSDVALLKIEAANLPRAVIGDPARVQVGEWVLAIGSPFGFDSSATTGIVSAKGRNLPNENYIPFIQTDVAINPGNSGGPLFNLKGEVIGINSQIFSRTGGFMGLSFAIPIDIAMRIGDQLKQDGFVRRGWLGLSLQEVSRDLAGAYGLPRPRGALVSDILAGGPAAKSDLRQGDIVLEYEGRPIELSSELAPLVGLTSPGTRARLTVFRRGQGQQPITVMVGELREEAVQRPLPVGRESGHPFGFAVNDLSAAERQRLDLDHGVRVRSVDDGPARDAGLLPDDVILEVEGRRAASVNDFDRLLAHAPKGRPLLLRIRRGAASLFLALRVEG